MKTYNPLYTIQQIAVTILVLNALLLIIHIPFAMESDTETPVLVIRWIMAALTFIGIIAILIISA